MKKNKNLKIILLCILLVLAFTIPFALAFIFYKLYPNRESYLIIGTSVFSCISIYIFLIMLIILKKLAKESKTTIIQYVKNCYKKHSKSLIIFAIIFLLVESAFVKHSYLYYKDIIEGSKEAIITDITIKKTYATYRSGANYYIVGYIDGKKTKLKLTRHAMPKKDTKKNIKTAKIHYYKNLKEIYEIKY